MTNGGDTQSKSETVTIAAIEQGAPLLAEAREIIGAFHAMIRNKAHGELGPWLERACASLMSFASGVIKDKAAVSAAITTFWSNRKTEGPITKLKLVKRKMYDTPSSTCCRLGCSAPHGQCCIKIASEPPLDPIGGPSPIPIDTFAAVEMARPWHARILTPGLGGPENGYPPSPFAVVFAQAHTLGWKTTAHAGEEGPSDYVAAAIGRLDVGRIDHGVQCEADPRLMRRLAREGHCPCGVPTLKVELKVFPPLEEHNLLGSACWPLLQGQLRRPGIFPECLDDTRCPIDGGNGLDRGRATDRGRQ